MKAIFVLLLCGLTCVLGKFNCNDDYPKECVDSSASDYFPDSFPENEADLEHFCKIAVKEVECEIDFAIECPRTLSGAFRQTYEDFLNTLKRICNKNDALHRKYLEKVSCLNKEKNPTEMECEDAVKEQEYCKRSAEVFQCIEDEISNKCGKDGGELVTVFFVQKYSVYKAFCPKQ